MVRVRRRVALSRACARRRARRRLHMRPSARVSRLSPSLCRARMEGRIPQSSLETERMNRVEICLAAATPAGASVRRVARAGGRACCGGETGSSRACPRTR
eukprot:scaffold23097_cov58-Phaeocystis_antarctica.AAC.3